MIFENEKKLLYIIRYTPSLFIISISIILASFFYLENKNNFEKEKEEIQIEHLEKSKELIKSEVQSVYEYIQRERASTEKDLKKTLDEALQNAYKTAITLYKNNQDKPKNEIKKIILDALRNVRFNDGRGYFFIYDMNGNNVMHPITPSLEGKEMINYQDLKGAYVVKDFIKLLQDKDEAYYEWYWYRPNDKEETEQRKIGLAKNFKPFNWFIGTGEYVEDFEKNVQEKVLRNIREIRYGNHGYIFIINYDSVYLSHIRKNFIGKNAIANNDTKAIRKVISDLKEISKNGEGYYSYIQNRKPGSDKPTEKISYVKGLNEWNWMIGTGFYQDDINQEIQHKKDILDEKLSEKITNTILISIVLTIILLFISLYISKALYRMFETYKRNIQKYIDENTKNQNILAQQSKMAAIGEMINNIAHQWRQPLSIITTSATGMKAQKEMDVLSDKALISGLDNINSASQYLSKTIDNFRYFFASDQRKTYFKLTKTIDKVVSLVEYGSYEDKIEIIKECEDIEMNNYENELIQVLLNIFNCSKDISDKRERKDKIFIIKTQKINDKIIITIKDNSGGIPENNLENIFDPYLSNNKTRSTSLGLFTSKETITKQMDGDIKIENIVFEYKGNNYKGVEIKIEFNL